MRRRRITFVTGTRAEYGLMRRTLAAIESHPALSPAVVATGMHLDASRGRSVRELSRVDARVPWPAGDGSAAHQARATGRAAARLVDVYERLGTEIVLVVGDRVEAFAAASAGHLSGRIVAHVHGGDRAAGQSDDALRHAISKLAHLHLAATRESADRLIRMGEDRWRVKVVGSPGIDRIRADAADRSALRSAGFDLPRHGFALLVLHPTSPDDRAERRRALLLLDTAQQAADWPIVVVWPNNDPGAGGIAAAWTMCERRANPRVRFVRNLDRSLFLGLLRDAAVLVGNSSAGIIEAASFGTPVLDIGPRQAGRLCSGNVRHLAFDASEIRLALHRIVRDPRGSRFAGRNVYGGGATADKIANLLASVPLTGRISRKLIAH
jgi:UDP-hydrolysing UDP-N-acetyl-D-glucosamine 2-epimerase